MPTKSVATELQDASRTWGVERQIQPLRSFRDSYGDLLTGAILDGDLFFNYRTAYEVDGIPYPPEGSPHSAAIYNWRPASSCYTSPEDLDGNGNCNCQPRGDSRVAAIDGDVCETCWLRRGVLVGVKSWNCPHN